MHSYIKKLFLLALPFLCYGNEVFAQQVQRETIGTLGGSSMVGNTYFHECTGQAYHTQAMSTSVVEVTPGFVQPLTEAIIKVDDKLEFSSYPNPVKDLLNIEWTEANTKTTIRLYNLHGVVVKTIEEPLNSSVQLDLQEMTSGMYILEIQQNSSVSRVSIIKI